MPLSDLLTAVVSAIVIIGTYAQLKMPEKTLDKPQSMG